MTDIERISTANQSFYAAHETRDIEAMAMVWEHSDRVVCVHPGWPILRGWDDVLRSWVDIFHGPGQSQFILTNESISTKGDIAWVTLDENLVDTNGAGTIAATNLFVRDHEGEWKLVTHHGSPVMNR
jgi:ketosteroid isomerase-like protein